MTRRRSRNSAPKPMDLVRFLTRRRKQKVAGIIVALLLFILVVIADQNGLLLDRGSDYEQYHDKTFIVTRVVDGDTLHVDAPDGSKSTTVIRLWGVDTPELARQGRKAQALAEKAKTATKDWCEGKRVRLVLEDHDSRGKYGRLLAYVQLSDSSWLNERLLQRGLAKSDDRFSHSRYDHYESLERDAKKAKLGIWK